LSSSTFSTFSLAFFLVWFHWIQALVWTFSSSNFWCIAFVQAVATLGRKKGNPFYFIVSSSWSLPFQPSKPCLRALLLPTLVPARHGKRADAAQRGAEHNAMPFRWRGIGLG
jgi:hypothetical protein